MAIIDNQEKIKTGNKAVFIVQFSFIPENQRGWR